MHHNKIRAYVRVARRAVRTRRPHLKLQRANRAVRMWMDFQSGDRRLPVWRLRAIIDAVFHSGAR